MNSSLGHGLLEFDDIVYIWPQLFEAQGAVHLVVFAFDGNEDIFHKQFFMSVTGVRRLQAGIGRRR